MTTNGEKTSIQLQDGEKLTSIMAYTQNLLILGQVITVEAIRVSTWLRTQSIPQYIRLYKTQTISFGGQSKPQFFQELFVPTPQVIAFHIKPPEHDPLDYNPKEEMRKMVPCVALVGAFHFNGKLRMSTHTSVSRFLEVGKENFTGMYDIEITQPATPAMGVIRVPFALLRNDSTFFSPHPE